MANAPSPPNAPPPSHDPRPVFFFDIDNCLYPRSKNIHTHMSRLIDAYFMTHLSLTQADANHLHQQYYQQYGLAIEGLVRHHKVDPLEYNRLVDDALPLDEILAPDPALRALLESVDKSRVKLWLFTNAYVTHGRRVVGLLGVGDLFEGMTYCDYGAGKMVCKPHAEMFERAEREAGVGEALEGTECFFVDDSRLNCEAAQGRGWTTVHKLEPEDGEPERRAAKHQVRSLEELRELFPQFFKGEKVANGKI